jgi:hypothetical protein
MKHKILFILVFLLCEPSATYSEAGDFSFSNFLNCFKEQSLPIVIDNENYGDAYAKKIHDHYVEKYFGICCPETKGLDLVKTNNDFVIVIYKTIWAGASIVLATFSQSGELIDSKGIAKYHGDSAGGVISRCTINKDLTLIIENRYYDLNKGVKVKDEKGLVSAKKEVFRIDHSGKIIE